MSFGVLQDNGVTFADTPLGELHQNNVWTSGSSYQLLKDSGVSFDGVAVQDAADHISGGDFNTTYDDLLSQGVTFDVDPTVAFGEDPATVLESDYGVSVNGSSMTALNGLPFETVRPGFVYSLDETGVITGTTPMADLTEPFVPADGEMGVYVPENDDVFEPGTTVARVERVFGQDVSEDLQNNLEDVLGKPEGSLPPDYYLNDPLEYTTNPDDENPLYGDDDPFVDDPDDPLDEYIGPVEEEDDIYEDDPNDPFDTCIGAQCDWGTEESFTDPEADYEIENDVTVTPFNPADNTDDYSWLDDPSFGEPDTGPDPFAEYTGD